MGYIPGGGCHMIYRLVQGLAKVFLYLYHRVEVEGLDRIPKEGPVLLVGNHVSYLDPFYMGAVFPRRVHYMAKQESFSHPVTAWFLRRFGAFPVNRDKPDVRTIKTAIGYLNMNRVVGLFPEGGRRDEAPMEELKQGAAYLALKTGSTLVPMYIEGTEEALPRKSKWIYPVRIRIRTGEPIQPQMTGKMRLEQERISREILGRFRDLAGLEKRK